MLTGTIYISVYASLLHEKMCTKLVSFVLAHLTNMMFKLRNNRQKHIKTFSDCLFTLTSKMMFVYNSMCLFT